MTDVEGKNGREPAGAARPQVSQLPLPRWKRTFDLAVAVPILVVASPAIAAIAAVNRILLGPPVLYRQARGGLGGSTFEIIKFRTMTNDRNAAGELLPDDQRRSRWGNFLRKTSLDELPTLVNIIRGEMSIVGPRPLMAHYLDRYTPRQALRHRVTPGLTGLAQTRGRNTLGWNERFELDLEYVQTRSATTDLRILCDTIAIVLTQHGADGNDHCQEFMGEPVSQADVALTDAKTTSP